MSRGAGFAHSQRVAYIDNNITNEEEKEKRLQEANELLAIEREMEKAKTERRKADLEKAAVARSKLLKTQSTDRTNREEKAKKQKVTTVTKPNWTIIFAVSTIIIVLVGFFIFMFRGRQTIVQPTFQQQFRQLPRQIPQMPQQFARMPGQVMSGGAKDMNNMIKFVKSLLG